MRMSSPVDHLALEAGSVGERRIADRRPQIGEQRQLLAQPQEPGLGPRLIGHALPLRAAHGAENHRVGGLRLRHGGVGDGDLVGVVAGAADQPLFGLEPREPVRIHPADELLDLGHHLGADAVAGKKQEFVPGHGEGGLS